MKTDILDLDSIPIPKGSLTIHEGFKRLRENPHDLQAQKFKKEFNDTVAEISARAQRLLEEIYDTPVQTILVAKQLSKPENILRVSSVKGVDLARRIKNLGNNNNTQRKIAQLFKDTSRVDKFEIIKFIVPRILGRNNKKRRLTRQDYLDGKDKYNKKIKNVFKYLKREAKFNRYTFRFSGSFVEIVQLEKDY